MNRLRFTGQVVNTGETCQISITYDSESAWKVIKPIKGFSFTSLHYVMKMI